MPLKQDPAELFQHLGWVVLVLALIVVAFTFGLFLAQAGIDQILHDFPGWGRRHSRLTGIELTIVPLSAIAAAWLQPGADRIRAIRETPVSPHVPLLMAAALVGLIAWLVWSWHLPQASFGPDGFGYARWLGTALAAAFTIFWLPLFPRLTAMLAGMIAGPAVFAGLGYLFFESFLTRPPEDCYESDCVLYGISLSLLALAIGFVLLGGFRFLAYNCLSSVLLLASFISLFFWFTESNVLRLIPLFLLSLALLPGTRPTEPHLSAHPLSCAVVIGALAVGLAALPHYD